MIAGGRARYEQVSFAVVYASSSTGAVHFGLGRSLAADSVKVHWPSGIVQELGGVPADQIIKVKEPSK